MNKIKILFTILLMFLIGEKTYAQKDTTKHLIQIKAGVTLVPQGYVDLQNTKQVFNKTYTNIFGGVTTIYGDLFNTSFYSMTFNQIGTAVGYYFTPDFLIYIVDCKSTMVGKNYLGVGVGTPLANGRATGFVEFGSLTKKWAPGMYVGMFIPFTRKLR